MTLKNPNVEVIARCNRAFFEAAIVAELRCVAFEDAAFQGQHRPHAYGFTHAGYPARVLVDATDLHDRESFLSDFHKAVDGVAERIPKSVRGDMHDRALVDVGEYRFRFQITGYWAGKSPDDGVFEDPTVFPSGEMLGREVELKITFGV